MNLASLVAAFSLAAAHVTAVGAVEQRLDIIGVWRVVDASEPAAKGEGGVVFRTDGTGEFYSASFKMDLPEDLAKLDLIPTSGRSDLHFTYAVHDGQVFTEIVAMNEMPANGNPDGWAITMSGTTMTMARTDGTVTFTLERVVLPK